MPHKIKILKATDSERLESKIENFLNKIDNDGSLGVPLPVQYSTATIGGDITLLEYSALIQYTSNN